jgi:Fe-S-cluster containining protein
MYEMHDIRPVGMRERIAFQCSQCGGCCRNVRDSVMLEPYDAYRLTKYLRQEDSEISIEEVVHKYGEMKLLSRGYNVYVIKTVNDSGVCPFLRDGKCGIYTARPRTCRLYPFCVAPADDGTRLSWHLCTERTEHFGKGSVTAREWQRKYLSREEESVLLAEFETVKELGRLMRQVPEPHLARATMYTLLYSYCFYDVDQPFLTQYISNNKELKRLLIALARE